ncbi:MAG: hypothetical protein IOD12_01835 [Silvanigrellales bacterium]|nr:hypothetical protein [Silvanigrellales bacterium]
MKPVTLRADVQVWVCVNAREPNATLASCTRERGEALAEAFRREFARAAAAHKITFWVNRTLCQGFCHAQGVTVTIEMTKVLQSLKFQAVQDTDVAPLVASVVARVTSLRPSQA